MNDVDLTWLTDQIDAGGNPSDPTHRVFQSFLRDLLALHPLTRDVFHRSHSPSHEFGCRTCHGDEYEFTEGLGWCPTVRQMASQNGIPLPDDPDDRRMKENRAMTTPPATFQAPPAEPVQPYPVQAPPPAPLPPQVQQTPVEQPPAAVAAVAASALQAEATPDVPQFQTVAVPYGGNVFTVPADRETWSLDVLEALEDDKLVRALRGLLGPKQWGRFKSTNPLTGDLGKLWEAIGKACGFDSLGE